ncbi:MAG: O-antigen ligase family protein [Patescibacteria group bacterium]
MSTKLIWAIKFLIYATFITPLIFMGDSFIFPFVFPTAIYFRILVELAFGLYLVLCLIDENYRPKKTPLFIILGVFFFILFLSTIFGVDFQRSMWGNYERMSGWFTLIHFGIYFVIVANIFRSWLEWRVLFRWSLLVSIIVGVTGFNFLLPDNSIMKIGGGGTLGNQIYIANFVLFHIFIAWYLFRKEEKKIWRIFAASAGILGLAIMMYNGKRGPFIGLVIGGFIAIALYSFFTKTKKWRALGLSLVGLMIVFGVLIFAFRQSSFVQKIPAVGQVANVSFESGTGATRLIAWKIALAAWKEKPVFGWGVENFYYAFNKYYNPKSLEHGYYETWFDRSHNIFLDYLSTSGILGLAGYLAIFAAVFWQIGAGFYKKKIDLDTLVFVSIFFIAYGVQNFFVFDHLSSYLIFFLMLAFVDYVIPRPQAEESFAERALTGASSRPALLKASKINKLPLVPACIIAAITLFSIYHFNVQPARANNQDLETQKTMQTNFVAGFEKMKQSLLINPYHLVDMRNDFARVIISYAQSPEALKSDIYQQSADFIIEELKKNIQEHPFELQSYILLGQFYGIKNNSGQAEDIFNSARELSPKRQQLAYYLVRIKAVQRDYAGALKILEQLVSENSNIADTYWYMALIYGDQNDFVNASQNLKLALTKGRSFTNQQELFYAAQMASQSGDWEMARDLYERALLADQKNSAILLVLSEIYSRLDDKSKAREMADRAALYDVDALKKAKKWLK